MPLESILGPEVTSWIAHVTALCTAFALLYGGAKILWVKLSGRPFPVNAVTRKLDALVELGSNLLGFLNKMRRADGSPLIPNPDVVARDALIADLRTALARVAVDAAKADAPPPDAAGLGPVLSHEMQRETLPPPPPAAPTPLRAVTLTGVALPPDASEAAYESARAFREQALPFDAAARQEIAPEVVAAARAASERGDE